MSWNLFSKSAAKNKIISQQSQKSFDRQRDEIAEFEKAYKKLMSDVKSASASFACVSKMGAKLAGCESHGSLLSVQKQLESCTKDGAHNIEVSVVDQLKKLNDLFPAYHNTLKRWENQLQECVKIQQKLEKLDIPKSAIANAGKISELKTALEHSRSDFFHLDRLLRDDMRIILQSRSSFFQPTLEALISSQLHYFDNSCGVIDQVSASLPPTASDNQCQIRERLLQIKALSITDDV